MVEDEPLLLMMGVEALTDAGFEVAEAWNADEAVRLLESEAGSIQAMLTDVNMPGTLDGLQLAELVSHRWPHIGLVVTSGHMLMRDEHVPDSGLFLPKPYRINAMLDCLNRAVGQQPT